MRDKGYFMSFGPQPSYKQVNNALDAAIGHRGNWNFRIGCEQQSHAVDYLWKRPDDFRASNYSEYPSPSTQGPSKCRCSSDANLMIGTAAASWDLLLCWRRIWRCDALIQLSFSGVEPEVPSRGIDGGL